MRKILIIFYLASYISCNQQNNKNNMQPNESSTDSNKSENSLPISFNEAEDIFIRYHNKNGFSQLKIVYYYYEKNFYYFGYHTDPLRDKRNAIKYFLEAKINAKTGELIKMDQPIDWK